MSGRLGLLRISVAAWAFSVSSLVQGGNEITSISSTPPDIEFDVVSRVWNLVKRAVRMPQDVPPPKLALDWHLPSFARMALQFPTTEFPSQQLQISIAPRAIEQYSAAMVSWAIGHELTHYAFLLRENQWNPRQSAFQSQIKHHCDAEFKQITRAIADEIWSIYHSESERRAMYREVERSCISHPDQ